MLINRRQKRKGKLPIITLSTMTKHNNYEALNPKSMCSINTHQHIKAHNHAESTRKENNSIRIMVNDSVPMGYTTQMSGATRLSGVVRTKIRGWGGGVGEVNHNTRCNQFLGEKDILFKPTWLIGLRQNGSGIMVEKWQKTKEN